MEIKVTARHFKAREEVRENAIALAEGFEKYYEGIISTEIILSFEKTSEHIKIAEFILHVNDHTIVAKESSEDFEKSLHIAAEKVVRQLQKLKTKAHKDLHSPEVEIVLPEDEFED